MIYLDTHVVVMLYLGDIGGLGRAGREQIEREDALVSPAVLLELEYLKEIRRLSASARSVLKALSTEIGLAVCDLPFATVVEHALDEKWAHDPFDRLIVAQAKANDAPLVTKDAQIRRHYRRAIW